MIGMQCHSNLEILQSSYFVGSQIPCKSRHGCVYIRTVKQCFARSIRNSNRAHVSTLDAIFDVQTLLPAAYDTVPEQQGRKSMQPGWKRWLALRKFGTVRGCGEDRCRCGTCTKSGKMTRRNRRNSFSPIEHQGSRRVTQYPSNGDLSA